MLTNEFEFDNTTTTVMNDEGSVPDVKVIINDDGVYIEQFLNENIDVATTIFLTHEMFRDMILATQLPEGSYTVR